ncbi:nucleotidyl transferase AbiEii/AbiGii toxin family protein, partial [Candidatus Daviesbacteria bacterium]|nr:nucleotidyl transferase AbiEii/AbiGii toxin family protein [Candidatus Daviesbacteria bacterium]
MNSILTDNQTELLKEAGSNKFITGQFYLTGGTALAEIYLHHRFSEDLDFFSEKEFDILGIDIFLKNLRSELNFHKTDFPRMIADVKIESWQNFFINESKRLKNDIL